LRHYVHILSVTVIVCNIPFHIWALAWVGKVKFSQKKLSKITSQQGLQAIYASLHEL